MMRCIAVGQWMVVLAALAAPVAGSAEVGSAGHPPGPPPGPPPVAIAACKQQAVGDNCEFVGRYGESLSGTCVVFPRLVACLPADVPPPPDTGDDIDR